MALENEYDIPFSLLNLQGSPDFTLTLPFFFFFSFLQNVPNKPLLKLPRKVFSFSSVREHLRFCSDRVYMWISHTYLVLFNLTSHQPFEPLNHFCSCLWILSGMMTSFWYGGFHKWTHLSDSWCVISACAAQTVFINHSIILGNLILIFCNYHSQVSFNITIFQVQ